MTHDELLAKIEKINLVSCDQTIDLLEKITICGKCFVCQALYALRAVVELHKPQNKHEVEFGLAKCDGCYLSYPCNTIQAIEKELK